MARRPRPVLATGATVSMVLLLLLAAPAHAADGPSDRGADAATALVAAEARLDHARGPLERIGLLGSGTGAARDRADAARSSGDESAMLAAAEDLDRLASGALGNGVQRLAATIGFALFAAFVAVLVRRRSRWVAGTGEGGDGGVGDDLDVWAPAGGGQVVRATDDRVRTPGEPALSGARV